MGRQQRHQTRPTAAINHKHGLAGNEAQFTLISTFNTLFISCSICVCLLYAGLVGKLVGSMLVCWRYHKAVMLPFDC